MFLPRSMRTWRLILHPYWNIIFLSRMMSILSGKSRYISSASPSCPKGDQKALWCKEIIPVKYSAWVANLVPIINNNLEIMLCVDFRNLNKASILYTCLLKVRSLGASIGESSWETSRSIFSRSPPFYYIMERGDNFIASSLRSSHFVFILRD